MVSKPESRLQEKIQTALKRSVGGFWFKAHGGAYQKRGLPDLIGCVKGRYFALEVKVPGNEATPLQEATMQKIRDAEGVSCVVESVEEALDAVRKTLR